MEQVNRLLSISRTTEVDTVTQNIINEFNSDDWSGDAYLTGLFDQLKPEAVKLTKAINRIKAESDLEEKDEVRDNRVRAIYYLVNGLIHHPDETISSAAKRVDDVLDNYGMKIVSESYATESSLIESLLVDLCGVDIK
ncbi:MAG: hypothetical protein K9J12_17020 [Melioribacteraceae bacterium]|nr:hypothetical protein [Melioribacteraceae bacterium]MCF8265728.1 hypothetical protein [Melioribacteraceae bacterium]